MLPETKLNSTPLTTMNWIWNFRRIWTEIRVITIKQKSYKSFGLEKKRSLKPENIPYEFQTNKITKESKNGKCLMKNANYTQKSNRWREMCVCVCVCDWLAGWLADGCRIAFVSDNAKFPAGQVPSHSSSNTAYHWASQLASWSAPPAPHRHHHRQHGSHSAKWITV